ncbi:unnamed protein product, partial [Closterium sp. Naga37s-1]
KAGEGKGEGGEGVGGMGREESGESMGMFQKDLTAQPGVLPQPANGSRDEVPPGRCRELRAGMSAQGGARAQRIKREQRAARHGRRGAREREGE